MRERGRKGRMAGVAEKRAALVAKEATRKLGYTDVKACQLEVIYSRPSERSRCVAILVSAKQSMRFELQLRNRLRNNRIPVTQVYNTRFT